MLSLQGFIQESLLQVVRGVAGACRASSGALEVMGSKAIDGVLGVSLSSPEINPLQRLPSELHIQMITFDIAVVVEERETKEGGGEIKVWSVSAGGKANSESARSQTSRLQFAVPVRLPHVAPKE